MCITILVITGFQAYWLKNNYAREFRTLEIKTNMAFHRTIYQLQASKLRIDIRNDTNRPGQIRVFKNLPDKTISVRVAPKQDILEMATILRDGISDSLQEENDAGRTEFLPMERRNVYYENVSGDSVKRRFPNVRSKAVLQFLYGVDSLQDSIRINEIIPAYSQALIKENAIVPFSVIRSNSVAKSEEPAFNEVTIGFAKPITYRLILGNTFPYLLQKISLPILFSIFLVGVTILSFVLLYRNILRQQKLAVIKNEFISNITHELKTPIATVGVAIEALRNFNAIQDPMRTKEYLDISANELQRLSLLVDKVLKLSMFENKKIELKYETVNLKDLVEEVISSLRLQFEKKGATVSVNGEGDLNLNGDRLHLLSVVYNLLDNALKYSGDSPVIAVGLKEEKNSIEMTVADNGIGISPEYKNKIFEKFFRVPMGNTHNTKGYGLGLSYAAHVVRQHLGAISVDSETGSGSKFTIILPKQPV